METRELGRSGISVSRVILGCGNFGGVGSAPEFFGQGIPKSEAFRIMDRAWELGVTTFDTADAYGGGRSETFIGDWLKTKDGSVRDAITIETKTFNPNEAGADHGLARVRILRQIDVSLGRLGLDRVALYLAHDCDPDVPQEETLRAFDELVRVGKVGAVGASNFDTGQLTEALEVSRREAITRYERYENDRVYDALEAFEHEAFGRGVSMAGLAIAWLISEPEVTAVVVGPTRAEHLEPVLEAVALELTSAERTHLRGLFA